MKFYSLLVFVFLFVLFFACQSIQIPANLNQLTDEPVEDVIDLISPAKPEPEQQITKPLEPVYDLKKIEKNEANLLKSPDLKEKINEPQIPQSKISSENSNQSLSVENKVQESTLNNPKVVESAKTNNNQTPSVQNKDMAKAQVVQPVLNTTGPNSEKYFPKDSQLSDRVRTIFARQGDEIEVAFPGKGWLLLEIPKEGSGLVFLGRQLLAEKTIFNFKGVKLGNFSLPFQYQDVLQGIISREIVELKIVAENEFSSVLNNKSEKLDSVERQKRLEQACRLADLGYYKEALAEYLTIYKEGDPALNEQIANLAFQLKDYENAIKFWRKNLKASEAFGDKAILGLVKSFIAVNDKKNLLAILPDLKKVRNFPIENELISIIRFLQKSSADDALNFELIGEYQRRYPQGRYLDEILFFLGQFYERFPAQRNFSKARACYKRLVVEYPESIYFLAAKERIAFIDRHFLKVQ